MTPFLILTCGIVVVVGGILFLRLHAFLALIFGALLVASLTSPLQLNEYAADKKLSIEETEQLAKSTAISRVSKEFGIACGNIGILIAMASIVGKCLMDSGAADRIVRSSMKQLGEERAAIAYLIGGYILSIPVFFDTVFLLMVPLCKATWMRTRKNYVLYICAIISGGSMNHSLVPLKPGPLIVASQLKVDLGTMILMGCIVGAITAAVGMAYAYWIDNQLQLPVRDSIQMPLSELEAEANQDERKLPALWLALVPIILPVVLISGTTVIDMCWKPAQIAQFSPAQKQLVSTLVWLGDANISLTFAAALSIAMFVWIKRPDKKQLSHAMSDALAEAGQIVLIIAAGGAFGGALKQTGIGAEIQHMVSGQAMAVLPVAFLVTMLVRAAQGSATVAMITAVGMFSALAAPGHLGFHPVYLALAIGCGSKPLAWMNDSGFWVISKTSGMTELETLKTFSAQTTLEGIAGLGIVMVLSRTLPLI